MSFITCLFIYILPKAYAENKTNISFSWDSTIFNYRMESVDHDSNSVDEQIEPTEVLLKKMDEIKSETEDSIQLLTFQELAIRIVKSDFNKGNILVSSSSQY